jgi:hypothetical protein
VTLIWNEQLPTMVSKVILATMWSVAIVVSQQWPRFPTLQQCVKTTALVPSVQECVPREAPGHAGCQVSRKNAINRLRHGWGHKAFFAHARGKKKKQDLSERRPYEFVKWEQQCNSA